MKNTSYVSIVLMFSILFWFILPPSFGECADSSFRLTNSFLNDLKIQLGIKVLNISSGKRIGKGDHINLIITNNRPLSKYFNIDWLKNGSKRFKLFFSGYSQGKSFSNWKLTSQKDNWETRLRYICGIWISDPELPRIIEAQKRGMRFMRFGVWTTVSATTSKWMTLSDFNKKVEAQKSNKFFPVFIQGEHRLEKHMYRAVFAPYFDGNFRWESYWGVSREKHSEKSSKLTKKGFEMVSNSIFKCPLKNIFYWQATWIRTD